MSSVSSLKPQIVHFNDASLQYGIFTSFAGPYIPVEYSSQVFKTIHNLAHPDGKPFCNTFVTITYNNINLSPYHCFLETLVSSFRLSQNHYHRLESTLFKTITKLFKTFKNNSLSNSIKWLGTTSIELLMLLLCTVLNCLGTKYFQQYFLV